VDRPLYADSDTDSHSGEEGTIPRSISVGELLLLMFDLVAAHKATNSLTRDIWSVIRLAVPAGTDIASYQVAEQIVRAHIKEALVVLMSLHNCIDSTTTTTTAHATTTSTCTSTFTTSTTPTTILLVGVVLLLLLYCSTGYSCLPQRLLRIL
jgi:hypothetical protein